MIMTDKDLKEIVGHSMYNRDELRRSRVCGCYYCQRIYQPSVLNPREDYTDGGRTAICPYCGIDAVIGDAIGVEITNKLLYRMYIHSFT